MAERGQLDINAPGLEVVVNQPFSPSPAITKLGNTLGVQSRYAASRAPIPGTSATLTPIEFQGLDQPLDRKPPAGRIRDPGTAILQLRVADVAALAKKLKAAGIPAIATGGEPAAAVEKLKTRDPNNSHLEQMQ